MPPIDFNRLNGPQRKILRETLTAVFGGARELDMFLVEHGFEALGDVVESGPFKNQVFDLISLLMRQGKLPRLVAEVRREYDDNPQLSELDAKLRLADVAAENQRVVRPVGLERMVRDAGFADLNVWTTRLLAAGRKICRLSYMSPQGLIRGTAFLVARDRVLTNYHVIEPLKKGDASPEGVRLLFGYAETGEGLEAGDQYRLGNKWLIAHSPYSAADLAVEQGLPAPHELDFALLQLDRPAGEDASRGWFDLGAVAGPPAEGGIVFVLQHPRGESLKQSIGIVKQPVTKLRLRYDADTRSGSSGALVLDQHLDPVALHHAGDPDFKVKAAFNQGIPLQLIRQALETNAAVPRFWSTPPAGASE